MSVFLTNNLFWLELICFILKYLKMTNILSSMDIDNIMGLIEKNSNISDLHLSWDESIAYRLNWEIIRQEQAGKLTNENIEIILRQLFQWNPQRFDKFLADKEADFAYLSKDWTSYRVNTYLKTGRIWIVMRKINNKAKPLEELMFSNIADNIKKQILTAKNGLYLITGPTWAGKSTTMVAMLEYLNQMRNENIVTIEDPIEFIFQPKKCLISQREIGHDTWSFKNALRWSMRQDPDIIFVWEIRDTETAESVLSLAETGHLVFSTLHTSSSSHTINRFISFFDPSIQQSIRERFADALLWIQSQVLVKTKDWNNRVALFEVMLNNTAIKNNLKKRDTDQLDNIIESWYTQWMIKLKQYAERLIDKNIIDRTEVDRLLNKIINKI